MDSPEPRNTAKDFAKNPLEMNIDEIEEIISEKELIQIENNSDEVQMSEEKSPEQELIIWGKYKTETKV